MMEAEELMISYSTIAKRSGLVWEVVERARFGSLDGQKKVMCLRATVSKHLYRLELAPKVREFITTGLRDYSLPLNSGEGDLHTKWIGSESQAIIQHCDYIANEVRKFLFEKKISPCIMTKGDISLGQWKTCHGVAGLLAHLYKDVPGPKSNRVAHHQPSTHLRKIIETLQNQFPSPCSKDGDLLLEEQSTDSAKICSDTNVEAANIRKRNRNVSMKSMTDGIRKTGTNRRRNVKKKTIANPQTKDLRDEDQIRNETFPLQSHLDRNGDINRSFSRLAPRYPIRLEGKKPRTPIPRSPPGTHPRNRFISPPRAQNRSRSNFILLSAYRTGSGTDESNHVEEDILASGYAGQGPLEKPMNETEDIESQGHEIRSLIDLEDSEDANNFFEERRDKRVLWPRFSISINLECRK